jgi:hypothetical protein
MKSSPFFFFFFFTPHKPRNFYLPENAKAAGANPKEIYKKYLSKKKTKQK